MKKVLFMIDSLNGGGAEKVLIDILKRLDYTKLDVTVFLVYGEGVYIKDLPSQVHLKYLLEGYNKVNAWPLLKKYIYKAYRKLVLLYMKLTKGRPIYQFILKEQYDLEISFLEGITCLFVGNSKNNNSEKISWIHIDLEKRRTIRQKDEKAALDNMDRIICVSNGSRQSVINLYPDLEEKIKVIYNPIDKEEILAKSNEPIAVKSENVLLVCVGRLEMQKGHYFLINAHKELIDEGVKHNILILGEGGYRNEIEKQIDELSVKDSITLMGYIGNPYPYIKAADALVLPSLFEGFSLVLAEAIVLGKPTIATKCAGPMEILEDKYGLMVEPGDTKSLKEAMKKMILDQNVRQFYAEKSLERNKLFDIDAVMHEIKTTLQL